MSVVFPVIRRTKPMGRRLHAFLTSKVEYQFVFGMQYKAKVV